MSISGILSVTPDRRVLETLIENIDSTKSRFWIQIYTWTEKGTIDAIIRAASR
jgi:hypothetical protein